MLVRTDDDLGRFMEPVARALLGDPNPRLSSKTELCFGSQGSMKIDLEKGTAYSHEEKTGGGVLWLINREKKLEGKAAFEFLHQIGCDVQLLNSRASAAAPLGKVVASYNYVDENHELLFQVARFEPKTFRQRRPDPAEPSGWSFRVQGVRQIPYRLPVLIEAIAEDRPVFIVEGEKDVDNLARWKIPATCNAGGAGKWPDSLNIFFRDADVIIIPDNDPQAKRDDGSLVFYAADHAEFPGQPAHPGQDHAEMVARRLEGFARRIRILNLPGLPSKGDVTDWIKAGGTVEQLNAFAEAASDWTRRPKMLVSRFGGMRWETIGKAGSLHYEWIVEDIIPKGEITIAFGDSGTGKSFSMFDMSLQVARGLPFYGKNVEQGLVIYVAAEAGKGFAKRKHAYVAHHGIGDDLVSFYLMTRRPDFFSSDDDCNALIAEIEGIKATYNVPLVLIVLDTISALTPGMNENASQDVSRFRLRLQRVLDAFIEAAIVAIHHKPKGGNGPRGHGSLTGDYETTIEFQTLEFKSPEGLAVHQAIGRKQREGKKGLAWEFTLPVIDVGLNKWGNPETSCVAVPFTVQRRAASLGFQATPNEIQFMEALFEAIAQYGEPPPPGLPAGITRAVDIAHVRLAMKSRLIPGDEDQTKADNRFRAAFKRAGDALRRGAVIGFQKPLFWYTGKPVRGLSQAMMMPVEVET